MATRSIACILALLPAVVAAQELPPEVLLLQRIRVHLAQEVERMPNYTCLETVTRFHKQAWERRLTPLDTVRLEIIYSDRREWYGPPGERRLVSTRPIEFVSSGMIGNGAFAMALHNILSSADIHFAGEQEEGGRKPVRYDFRPARNLKPLEITLQGGQGTVGEEGSFWADPQSLDLLRVESRVIEIPPYLPLAESSSSVTYARTRIGPSSALLPQRSTLHMLETSGVEGYDRLDFTHCRSFSTESSIRFDAVPELAPAADTSAYDAPNGAVPPFLPVTLQLTTPITERDAVGDMIHAKVMSEVKHKGKVAIADGAAVRGRIRILERREMMGDYLVGLEFTEVDAASGTLRFFADFLKAEKNSRIGAAVPEAIRLPIAFGKPGEVKLKLPDLPGVASLSVTGKKFTIPAGFRMFWRTRGLLR